MTTIRVSDELKDVLEAKKNLYKFHSKEEMIWFALGHLKTPQELIRSDLNLIKEHLSLLERDDISELLESMLEDAMKDIRLIKLREEYLNMKASIGQMDRRAFKTCCDRVNINKYEYDKYLELLMEELSD